MPHWLCSICKALLNDIKTLSITPCGHAFHLECIEKWIVKSVTCPECRQSVSSSRLVKLDPIDLPWEAYKNHPLEQPWEVCKKHYLDSKPEEVWEIACRCLRHLTQSQEEKCDLESQLKTVNSQKNLIIKDFESKIANFEEINRQLNFENEHINRYITVLNYSWFEKFYSLFVAKDMVSFCFDKKCELDRVIDEKKALEFKIEEVKYECINKNLNLTQLQKEMEKLKKKISLLETKKCDSSGCDYSKDTPTRKWYNRYITENGIDISPITVKFAENQKKKGIRIMEDEMPTTTKISIFNIKKVELSSSSTVACQDDSITRIVYDGFKERPSVINRSLKKKLPKCLMGKKTKSTFSQCELSPMLKRKRNNKKKSIVNLL